MKIAGATVNQIPLDWKNNTENILQAIRAAEKQNVRLLSFPELCITGYGCEDLFLSDWVPEKAVEYLFEIKEHVGDMFVCVGLPIRIENTTYNGAAVMHNRHIIGITLKQNLAKDGVHYEPRWFEEWTPGQTITIELGDESVPVGDIIYKADGIEFGFEICEDAWRKNKRPGYRLKERGVDLIINPSASHYAMGKSVLREQEVIIEGSSKFQCAYLFVNHLGNEAGKMIYDGDIVIGQHGKLLGVNKRLSFQNYNLLACEINFEDPESSQVLPTTDNKEANEEVTQAVSLALYDYLRKSKAKGYVVSLSGGADSSLCAVFVAEMVKRAAAELGWKKFCSSLSLNEDEIRSDWKKAVNKLLACAYQGTKNSSKETFNAAKTLADSIGAQFHSWTIDDEVSSYTMKMETALGRKLTWQGDDITLQNIQARARSPIIWMLANIQRAVLLTTSNRSEGDVGYATMDGDTSGSLAPIAGLSKVFILQWLKWAEPTLKHDGLKAVNKLQPTAELRPLERNQTDEADLMPYAVLAEIEKHAVRDRRSPREVYDLMRVTHDAAQIGIYIKKFYRLWAANQWKRERTAPSFHLDDFSVDPRSWCRFPILSSSFENELATF
jgi:NAD+ synthase (glutamine-hydrolysing)